MNLVVGPPWLRVTVTARDAELARRLAAQLAQAGAEEKPDAEGRLVTVEATTNGDAPAGPEVTCEDNVFLIRRDGNEGRYDLGIGRGEARLTRLSGAFFETYLRQVFLWESYRTGGLALHAVAFGDGDSAIASCGPSESGKSTLARMLNGTFAVYSDEMNVVAPDGRVWGLPFRGTGVEKARAGGGRLVALTFHRPGDEFAVTALDAAEAARNLWPNVFVPEGADAELKLAAFERVVGLASRLRSFIVEVPLDGVATREGFSNMLKTTLKDGGL